MSFYRVALARNLPRDSSVVVKRMPTGRRGTVLAFEGERACCRKGAEDLFVVAFVDGLLLYMSAVEAKRFLESERDDEGRLVRETSGLGERVWNLFLAQGA